MPTCTPLRHRKKSVTVKADAWSFSCTVINIATGVVPWSGMDVMEIMYQVRARLCAGVI